MLSHWDDIYNSAINLIRWMCNIVTLLHTNNKAKYDNISKLANDAVLLNITFAVIVFYGI